MVYALHRNVSTGVLQLGVGHLSQPVRTICSLETLSSVNSTLFCRWYMLQRHVHGPTYELESTKALLLLWSNINSKALNSLWANEFISFSFYTYSTLHYHSNHKMLEFTNKRRLFEYFGTLLKGVHFGKNGQVLQIHHLKIKHFLVAPMCSGSLFTSDVLLCCFVLNMAKLKVISFVHQKITWHCLF